VPFQNTVSGTATTTTAATTTPSAAAIIGWVRDANREVARMSVRVRVW
jgi:hypothetical protein